MRAALSLLLLAAACAPRTESFFQPRPGAADTNPAVVSACRAEATRVLARQDRSQLIREDERDARLGAEATPFTHRATQDRLGRGFQYDRLVNDCIRDNTRQTQRAVPVNPSPAVPGR